MPEQGVLAVSDIVQFLNSKLLATGIRPNNPPPTVRPTPPMRVFAAMPFASLYDDTHVVAIEPACLDVGAGCTGADYSSHAGDIVGQIKALITGSVAVVADLSESRPNVLFEIGYASALGRPVVQICSTPLDQIPFDVRNDKTLPYAIGQTAKLRLKLFAELKKSVPA
jgi:hypothetical protein